MTITRPISPRLLEANLLTYQDDQIVRWAVNKCPWQFSFLVRPRLLLTGPPRGHAIFCAWHRAAAAAGAAAGSRRSRRGHVALGARMMAIR